VPRPKNGPRVRVPYPRGSRVGSANLGFEQTLWQAADKLRGNTDASDYKHVASRANPTPIPKTATNTPPRPTDAGDRGAWFRLS